MVSNGIGHGGEFDVEENVRKVVEREKDADGCGWHGRRTS